MIMILEDLLNDFQKDRTQTLSNCCTVRTVVSQIFRKSFVKIVSFYGR